MLRISDCSIGRAKSTSLLMLFTMFPSSNATQRKHYAEYNKVTWKFVVPPSIFLLQLQINFYSNSSFVPYLIVYLVLLLFRELKYEGNWQYGSTYERFAASLSQCCSWRTPLCLHRVADEIHPNFRNRRKCVRGCPPLHCRTTQSGIVPY